MGLEGVVSKMWVMPYRPLGQGEVPDLLDGQLVEHLAEMPAQLQIQSLPSTLRNEDDLVFALPHRVA
jgi:hypothetical protein